MQIHVDTAVDKPHIIRHAAYLLLAHLGDIDNEPGETPALPKPEVLAPPPPPPPPPPTVATADDEGEDLEIEIPPPPPPPPVAPAAAMAPASTSTSTGTAQLAAIGPAPTADGAVMSAPAQAPAMAGTAATSLFDSSGMPWDARIHQSGKSQKKDGTWKLKKGIDQALVTSVVQELAAAKQGGAPSTVSLFPAPAAAVPLPPQSAGTAPVLAQTGSVSMPAPAASPVGAVGPSFRDLVNKFSAATKSGALRADEVPAICQQAGSPNLSALMGKPEAIAQVDALLDARLLGG